MVLSTLASRRPKRVSKSYSIHSILKIFCECGYHWCCDWASCTVGYDGNLLGFTIQHKILPHIQAMLRRGTAALYRREINIKLNLIYHVHVCQTNITITKWINSYWCRYQRMTIYRYTYMTGDMVSKFRPQLHSLIGLHWFKVWVCYSTLSVSILNVH